MPKYHVNGDGIVSVCTAQKRGCPLGGDEAHGSTRSEAAAMYEAKMSGATVPAPTKLIPSTPESLAALKEAAETAAEDVAIARNDLTRAGAMASERLLALYDRESKTYADPVQGELVHSLTNLQTRAMYDILDAEEAVGEDWAGPLDAHPAVKPLTDAIENVKKCGQLVSTQLRSLWDPETKRYNDEAQTAFLHNIINVQVNVVARLRFAQQEFTDPV